MEYITIVALVLFITGPLMYVFYKNTAATQETIDTNQITQIANKIADSAESVYYLGSGAKTTIKVYMPKNVINMSTGNNEISFKMQHQGKQSDFVAYTPINVTGTISFHSGVHYIILESQGAYVEVSEQ